MSSLIFSARLDASREVAAIKRRTGILPVSILLLSERLRMYETGRMPCPTVSAHQLLLEVADNLADAGIDFHAVFHEAAGMQDGAVIAAAKGFADGTERAFGHLTRQEHRDLAWESDIFRAALAGHVGQANVKMFGHLFLNDFDADGIAAFLVQDFAEQSF